MRETLESVFKTYKKDAFEEIDIEDTSIEIADNFNSITLEHEFIHKISI